MNVEGSGSSRLGALEWKRGALLSLSFFLVVLGILFTRPLRSALLLEHHSPDMLPLLWICTGVLAFGWIALHNRLLRHFIPEKIFLGSAVGTVVSLYLIKEGFRFDPARASQALYIWNDIASIVVIEQIWSLLDDYFNSAQAKRAFGPIGAGGILGGIAGAWLSTRMIEHASTLALLDTSVWIMLLLVLPCGLVAFRARRKFDVRRVEFRRGFRLIREARFLQLFALSVLLVQVVSNVIDLQFNSYVNETFRTTDDRSRYLGHFFFWMNSFSVLVMIVLPAWLLRRFGVRTGLFVLPVLNSAAAIGSAFGFQSAFPAAKFLDKGLNYSIQRASKEILYIPIRSEDRFQLKQILDVFFYRMSETVAALLVIPFLKLFRWHHLGFLTLALCVAQIAVVVGLFRALRAYRSSEI